MEEEIWKEIVLQETVLEVSNLGKVRNKETGKVLKPYKMGDYRLIYIKGKMYLIHRLVAQLFVPNPNNYPYVLLGNNNLHDVRATNLFWSKKRGIENQDHQQFSEERKAKIKATQKTLKESNSVIITEEQIKEMKQLHAEGMSYKDIAAKFGRSKTGVFNVINNKRSEKFAFRYKPLLNYLPK